MTSSWIPVNIDKYNDMIARHEFIVKVLNVFWMNDIQELLFYRVDHGKPSFFVLCSDVFYWGTADLEEITPNNIEELQRSIDDIAKANRDAALGCILFCSRVRNLRPQGAWLERIDSEVWPLFDAAGPHRDTSIDNPHPHPIEAMQNERGT